MMPIDDPSWPTCAIKGCANYGALSDGWCVHVRDMFLTGKDAPDFKPGMNYCVPIVAELRLYAEVNLGIEEIATDPLMLELSLVKPDKDSFGLLDEMISLGLYVHGEGRFEIASAILAWTDANTLKECKFHKHSYQQEMQVQKIARENDTNGTKAMSWCLAYYEMCLPCRVTELYPPGASGTSASTPAFDAKSFGLDNTVNAPYSPASTESAAANALKNRFGNRA
jgi:hypothetical protein